MPRGIPNKKPAKGQKNLNLTADFSKEVKQASLQLAVNLPVELKLVNGFMIGTLTCTKDGITYKRANAKCKKGTLSWAMLEKVMGLDL